MGTLLCEVFFVIMFFLHYRKFAGNHIVQTQLMNDLLVGTRVSVMLVQKIQDFQRIHLKTSSSPTWQSMCGLLSIFTKFLSDGKCKTIKMMIIIECHSAFANNGTKCSILSWDVGLLLPQPLKTWISPGLWGFNAFSFKCTSSIRGNVEGLF